MLLCLERHRVTLDSRRWPPASAAACEVLCPIRGWLFQHRGRAFVRRDFAYRMEMRSPTRRDPASR
jgi:hypothetical protein